MTIFFPFVCVAFFVTGFTAIQTGRIAWSRTKVITGQTAKIIGVVLIMVGVAVAAFSLYFSLLYHNAMRN